MTHKKRTILIIEDNKDLQIIYQHSFEKYGYTVYVEGDGKGGVERVAALMPDVILLDLMMPGMDGFGFLHAMKSTGGLSIPIIVCSNISDLNIIERAKKEGVEDVLLKVDYSGKQLVDKVSYITDAYYKHHMDSLKEGKTP